MKMWSAKKCIIHKSAEDENCEKTGITRVWKRKTSVENFYRYEKSMRKNVLFPVEIEFFLELNKHFQHIQNYKKALMHQAFLSYSQSFPQPVENFIYRWKS